MSPENRDLTIESVLADPLIRAANKADQVSMQDFEALLRATARDLKTSPRNTWRALVKSPGAKTLCDDRSACFA